MRPFKIIVSQIVMKEPTADLPVYVNKAELARRAAEAAAAENDEDLDMDDDDDFDDDFDGERPLDLKDCVDAGSCPASNRQGAIRSRKDDGIALHVLDDAPAKLQRPHLVVGGLPFRHHLRVCEIFRGAVGFLEQEPAIDPPPLEFRPVQTSRIEGQ